MRQLRTTTGPDKTAHPTFVSASLCPRCLYIISSDNLKRVDELSRSSNHSDFIHHHDITSFQDAVRIGCYICVRIRDKHSPKTAGIISITDPPSFTTYTIPRKSSEMVEVQIHLRTSPDTFIFMGFGLFASTSEHLRTIYTVSAS